MIRQILYEMRHQPLVSWLTVGGTALALFLVLTIYMTSKIDTVPLAPESDRDRIFYGEGVEVLNMGSTGFSPWFADIVYKNLDGIEYFSMTEFGASPVSVEAEGGDPETGTFLGVDGDYFKIYDFNFEEGGPFDKEAAEAGEPVIVISRSMATKLLGKGTPAVGRTINMSGKDYVVKGVYSDVNPIFKKTFYCGFYPFRLSPGYDTETRVFGRAAAVIKAKEGVTRESLARQVENRYKLVDNQFKDNETKIECVYHGQPYDAEAIALPHGTNNTPDIESNRNQRYIFYIILLILPAINLSSLTRSRLRTRVSEIGVRRAFGCTRLSIIGQFIAENFILSLIGGIIGLLLSFLFITTASDLFITYSGWLTDEAQLNARPTFGMLFSWGVFLLALLFCFVLNLLSASVPAWKATGIKPAEALSAREEGR